MREGSRRSQGERDGVDTGFVAKDQEREEGNSIERRKE